MEIPFLLGLFINLGMLIFGIVIGYSIKKDALGLRGEGK